MWGAIPAMHFSILKSSIFSAFLLGLTINSLRIMAGFKNVYSLRDMNVY